MHIPIEPDAMNGLKLNFLLSKNPSASEMVWCVKLRPITPLLATGSYGCPIFDRSRSCTLKTVNADRITRSAGCSHSSPEVSTKVTPVARLPERSVLMRVTSEWSRTAKFDLRIKTGRIVVCGLALEYLPHPNHSQKPQ